MIQDRAALLWVDQSRLHRSEPVVRPLRRCRPSRLPALRSRSGRGRHLRARAREPALIVRDALDALKMPSLVKTTGSKGLHVYVPIVRGPVQKQVWTFAKALAQELAASSSRAHHGRVPRGQASAGPRARRLQPERLGPDAGVDLFGAPAAGRDRVDAGDLEGDRPRRPHRGLHDQERASANRQVGATCGSRFWRREAGSISPSICKPRPARARTAFLTLAIRKDSSNRNGSVQDLLQHDLVRTI